MVEFIGRMIAGSVWVSLALVYVLLLLLPVWVATAVVLFIGAQG